MRIRTLSATAALLVPLALAAPVAAAQADPAPAASLPASSPLLTFVPPKVAPITVSIGPSILGGQMVSPGLTVSSPGVSLPPLAVMVPQRPA
jgi:hypothetical protein